MKQYYEYVWDITFMIPTRDISFRPYSLVEFRKNCDYYNNFIPSFEMKCKIQDKYLDFFRFYDKELFVRIKQYLFYGEAPDNKTSRALVFEDTFAIYIDKSTIPSLSRMNKRQATQKIDDTIKKDKYTENTLTQEVPIELHMNLLLRDDLKMKTYIHNYIFGSEDSPVAPITAAVACINLNPYIKKFIIDKPDNTSKYTDLIVEPGELKQVLYNIQRKYGIYSKSLELFYENGILYVLNKLSPTHTKTKGETNIINIKIAERKDTLINNDGFVTVDSDKNVYYTRSTTLFKSDLESIEGVLNGDKFVYSNFGTIINSAFSKDGDTTFVSPLNEITKPRSSRKDVGVKQIVDYDMLNNPFNMSSFMYENSQGVPIAFTLVGVNSKHFSPNKNIKISFDTPESNKLYSGIYNIKSANYVFSTLNRPNARFRTFGHVTLTLFNKQDGYDKDYDVKEPE